MTIPQSDRKDWVLLPWDSEHFGFPVGRILPTTVPDDKLSSLLRSIEGSGIRCLYWLTEENDSPLAVAYREGFEKVDVRVELEVKLGGAKFLPDPGLIRVAEDSDLSQLRTLAACSHRNTRFYTGAFPRARADALYSAWIDRSFHDPSERVLVSGPVGAPYGYIAFGVSESGNGSIGLVAVDESRRGRGVGSALVSAALSDLRLQETKHVTVVTQGTNRPALDLYRDFGFSVRTRSVWLHRWFGVSSPWT